MNCNTLFPRVISQLQDQLPANPKYFAVSYLFFSSGTVDLAPSVFPSDLISPHPYNMMLPPQCLMPYSLYCIQF